MNYGRLVVCLGLVCLTGSTRGFAAKPFVLIVERNMACRDGNTVGRLLIDGKQVARTLEPGLPGNRIPAGDYAALIRADGDLGWRVELKDVPGWTNTQLHVGNYPSETRGCILLGTDVQRG